MVRAVMPLTGSCSAPSTGPATAGRIRMAPAVVPAAANNAPPVQASAALAGFSARRPPHQ
ncbi:hypothetical protein roselon_03020 [Roseibacterium elongatum DSM 19469]|uniref:Uncharacterized protein n=1 Tax=Roseicyclus elongatus DSM 19469 TaxID=1294273 RepID=W8RVI5_9RHOB|nr:hypothetical protein roselon_03020 [Roseibacterium elongatum DSM 19469]